MDIFHDPIRHLKYLRQSLSQDNEAIGFFISAGCPLSIEMPVDEWPLIPDVKGLTIFIHNQLKEYEKFKVLIAELEKAEIDTKNIERILSFLRTLLVVSKGSNVRGLSEKDLSDLEQYICTAIVKKLNVNLPNQETPYHRLCNWIGSIDRKIAIELFTTNYDLLMEEALEDLKVPYFDGFVGSRKSFFDLQALEENLIPTHWSRLWKIHGSINWYQEIIEKEKKVHRSSEIMKDASHLIYPSHLKYEESRKMPYLALMDQLSRFIRKKSSFLILSGYSFGDGHINDTIVNALKANPTAMVLGLMHEQYEIDGGLDKSIERYPEAYKLAKKQHNLNIWTFNKAIIGTNLGDWKRAKNTEEDDIDLSKFVLDYDGDDGLKTHVRLGDFNEFTNLLKIIIGTSKEKEDV